MYLAHISEDKLREQSIIEHAREAAKLCGMFAACFDCKEWGEGCGLVHDIGKYSMEFSQRLHGGPKVDHATAGAQELFRNRNVMQAYCVAGHHSGLPDGGSPAEPATFYGRMKKELKDYHAFKEEIEIPAFPAAPLRPIGKGGFSAAFFIRMLFSCLVDADYLDTERFMKQGKIFRGNYDSIEQLFDRLYKYIASWLINYDEDTVNGRRSAILRACLEKGKEQQGLYQLTLPTGGGKTVSSLAFALQHAKEHHLGRVIYVIPFTSIIEQNAQVFKDILGKNNVLENHCNVVCDNDEELEDMQLAAENWDKPVIVTTNVQFFESLFANKTSKCRKIHNISKSVIIFDEAQMLPVNYLRPCIQAVSELIYNYHCSVVLCTATQPALKPFFPEFIKAEEICPDVKGQYEFFKRTNVKSIGEISEETLISELEEKQQVLCILNSRKRVQRVYGSLKGKNTYHLSTYMYPKHRRSILDRITRNLKHGRPCKLIATSLVEAGVDFDFASVFRELAGIDSVIQAAGRCNREGNREKDESETIIFSLEQSEDIHIPAQLKLPISVAKQITKKYEDITSPEAIHEYFQRLYHFRGESLDIKNIVESFEKGIPSFNFPFATAAKEFHIIESQTKTILVDKEPEAMELVERLRRGEHSRELFRAAGQYCVSVYENDFENLDGAGMLDALCTDIDTDFYVLRDKELYTDDRGLTVRAERGDALLW